MKKRTKPPNKVTDDILFRADHKCCICRLIDVNPQLHHIDEDPANNNPDNLAPVCSNCQDKIHKEGGTGRSYSQGEIKKYRDDWIERVERKRQLVKEHNRTIAKQIQNKNIDILSILAQHDVMLIRHEIEFAHTNWDEIKRLLPKFIPYGNEFGYEVRSEILDVAYSISGWIRLGTIKDVIDALVHVVRSSSSIRSIVSPSRWKITKKDIELIKMSIEIAFGILYESCKYLRQQEFVEKGCDLLIYIQRYTQVNKLRELEKKILEHFATCENLCDIERDSKKFIEGKATIKKCREEYY